VSLVQPFGGKTPVLGESVYLAPTSTVIGDVTMGEDSSLWFGSILRGDVGSIRVGKRTNIQDLTMVHVTGGKFNTEIGDEVTIGHRCVVHGCRIEDGCLLGIGSVILDGAVVGEGSVIGAGAVVTPGTTIPPRSMVLGLPAKVRRPLTDEEAKMGVEGAERYVALARMYAR
jgi:carbonic anhydrase/acetyltransferase-like protein (isoleucine patch superfamily)